VVVPGAVDGRGYVLVTRYASDSDQSLAWRTTDFLSAARQVESIDGPTPLWIATVDSEVKASALASTGLLGPSPGMELEFQRGLSMLVGAAQAVGLLDRALGMTVDYAKDRTAFGRPIGSFQAIKHMLADAKVVLECSRAILAAGVQKMDEADSAAPLATAIAARYVGRRVLEALQACVQVHGGIGVTMECELHSLIRRATALRFLYTEPFASGQAILQLYDNKEASWLRANS
jgi:hypothetical protein